MNKYFYLLILLGLVVFSSCFVFAETIEGDKVFVNDSQAYLEVYPHTQTNELEYIYPSLKTITFSGAINVVYCYDNDNVQPLSFEYKTNTTSDNGSQIIVWNELSVNPNNKVTWNNLTCRYVAGLNIQSNKLYETRILQKLNEEKEGKYWFCAYPTSYGSNIQTANINNNLYCLDPWYNVTDTLIYNITGLDSGLIHYWTFDEVGNQVADSINVSFNGTVYNSPTMSGKIGNSKLYVEGFPQTNYTNITNRAAGNFTNNFTISLWMLKYSDYPTGVGYAPTLWGSQATNYVKAVFNDDASSKNKISFHVYVGGNNRIIRTPDLSASSTNWYHVVFIKSDNLTQIYINGTLSNTTINTSVGSISGAINIDRALGIGSLVGAAEKSFNGSIDEFGIWNRVLNASEISQLYNNHAGLSYRSVINNTITFYAKNNITQATILSFTVNVSGNIYNTNDGALETNISQNLSRLYDIKVNSSGYYTYSQSNANLTSFLITYNLTPIAPTQPLINFPYNNVTVYDSINISYNVSVNVSGAISYYNISLLNEDGSFNRVIVGNNSLNTSYLWNVLSANLGLGRYKIKIEVTDINGLKNSSENNIKILANSTSSYVTNAYLGYITGFHILLSNYANITAIKLNYSNTIYNSFNYTLISNILEYTTNINTNNMIQNYTWNVSIMQANGTLEYFLFNNSFILIGYTLNLSFFEEITKNVFQPPTYPNITLYITGLNSNYSFSTTNISNGKADINSSIPYGEIMIRYSSLGNSTYLERTYYPTITYNTSLNLYLINNTISQTVRFQIKDVYGTSLNNIKIYLMRYYASTNSYETVEMCKTDINGNCYMQVQLATSTNNGEFYKLIFQSGSNIYLESQPSKIYDTVLYYQLQTTESTLADYNANLNLVYDITFNSVTNNFDFTWSNGQGSFVGGCLYVYKTVGLSQVSYASTCVNSTSSTILINIDNSSTSTYTAKAWAYYGSNPYYLGALTQSFKVGTEKNNIGKYGLFLAFIVILVFALISLYSAVIGIILTSVALIFFTWIGFISVAWSLVIGIIFGAIVVIMVNKRG